MEDNIKNNLSTNKRLNVNNFDLKLLIFIYVCTVLQNQMRHLIIFSQSA